MLNYFSVQIVPEPVQEIQAVAVGGDTHIRHVPHLALGAPADDQPEGPAAAAVHKLELSVCRGGFDFPAGGRFVVLPDPGLPVGEALPDALRVVERLGQGREVVVKGLGLDLKAVADFGEKSRILLGQLYAGALLKGGDFLALQGRAGRDVPLAQFFLNFRDGGFDFRGGFPRLDNAKLFPLDAQNV